MLCYISFSTLPCYTRLNPSYTSLTPYCTLVIPCKTHSASCYTTLSPLLHQHSDPVTPHSSPSCTQVILRCIHLSHAIYVLRPSHPVLRLHFISSVQSSHVVAAFQPQLHVTAPCFTPLSPHYTNFSVSYNPLILNYILYQPLSRAIHLVTSHSLPCYTFCFFISPLHSNQR